jgi:hypothetical protein
MRLLLAAFAAVLPIPHAALLKIDRAMIGRNYLPTRMIAGFAYRSETATNGILHARFANKAGLVIEWRVLPMTGSCDAGKQTSYQLAGNKVWGATVGGEQRAWRCVFDQRGKPLRLEAASTAPPNKLAGAGLGIVAASAKRY